MRLLIWILAMGQLLGCVRQPLETGYSDKAPYRPAPTVEVSMFVVESRVVAAYVRHSSGSILFRLSDGIGKRSLGTEEQFSQELFLRPQTPSPNSVPTLSSADLINFTSTRYEDFDRSFDMFQDGRIVLVPLDEDNRHMIGVFVNLISGRRYFLAPTLRSPESLAKVRSLAGRRHDVTVVVPEDTRIADRVAQFPEFRR